MVNRIETKNVIYPYIYKWGYKLEYKTYKIYGI